MRRCSASVSIEVSEAVGSSKMTMRCGASKARAICASWRWAIDSRSTGMVGRDFDAECAHRLHRAAVHRLVVERQTARRLAAEKHVLRHREMRREHDLLVDQHDAATLGVDRTAQADFRPVEPELASARRQMPRQDFHQGRLARAIFADDRVDLAGCDREIDVGEDLDRPEGTRQTNSLHHRTRCGRRFGLGVALRRMSHSSPSIYASWPCGRWHVRILLCAAPFVKGLSALGLARRDES